MKLATSMLLALGIAAFLPTLAPAQNVVQDQNNFIVTFDEEQGTALAEFITVYQRITGKVIHYEVKEIENIKIFQLGTKTVPKDRFDIYFGAVLRNLEFLIVQFGPEDAGFLALRKLGQQAR